MNMSSLDAGLNEQLTQLNYELHLFFRSTVGALTDS